VKIITSAGGDKIVIAHIDAVGKVKETIGLETVYVTLFKKIHIACGVKQVVIGYDFMFHTIGGCYYWRNFDTQEEAEQVRMSLLRDIVI